MNDGEITSASAILFLTNILSTVRIEKLTVPKLVEVGSSAQLNCEYSTRDNQFSVKWFFNKNTEPLYEWSPGKEPKISKFLHGRLDLPLLANDKHLTLKLMNLSPELSGSYTCSISSHTEPEESRLTQTMRVYSPEQDFELNMDQHGQYTAVICVARGLYPKPDMIIEYNNEVVRQGQQVWRREGHLYDVKSTAFLKQPPPCPEAAVVCRLQLPQADYTAFKKKLFYYAKQNCKNKSSSIIKYLEPITIYLSLMALLLFH